METRLNSPRIQDDRRVGVQPGTWDSEIVIKPEDIPGSSFTDKEIGKQKLNQLKLWLKCGRIRQTGNKNELLERLGKQTHISCDTRAFESAQFKPEIIFFFLGFEILIICQKSGTECMIHMSYHQASIIQPLHGNNSQSYKWYHTEQMLFWAFSLCSVILTLYLIDLL